MLHVILPWADLQKATVGTGVEGFACRLVQGRKAVLSDENQAIAPVHGFAHDLFLAWGNGGTHQHTASLSARQPFLAVVGILFIGIGSMDDDSNLLRDV